MYPFEIKSSMIPINSLLQFTIYLLIGTSEPLTQLIIVMNVLFFVIVVAYYLVILDKRNRKKHTVFIQGTWQRKGKTEEGEEWYINYTFKKGNKFEIEAVPEWKSRGVYKVLQEIENLLVLELHELLEEGQKKIERISIGVERKDERLVINNRIYQRIA